MSETTLSEVHSAKPGNAPRQSIAYFNEEVCRFREMMGRADFWARENPANALGALFIVYVNLSGLTPEDQHRADITYQSTFDEFSRRQVHVDMMRIFGRRQG